MFAPVALAGSSWDHTRGWVGKWAPFVIALILSKVVLVVIFLLATAQVSAPIDADLKSVSEPIAGVVLMLMAGFAPYLTYKAISFMGFDMYHAMSAEQEAKSALNRPLPIPMSRAPSPSRARCSTAAPWRFRRRRLEWSPAPPLAAGIAVRRAGSGAGAASAVAAALPRVAAAAGGVAAGRGRREGGRHRRRPTVGPVGAAASQQTDAAQTRRPAAPAGAPTPPHVADSVPRPANGRRTEPMSNHASLRTTTSWRR